MNNERIQEIVLGAILLEKDAYSVVSSILSESCFTGYYADVFRAMQQVNVASKPIDLITVTQYLKSIRSNIKPYDVAALTNKVASTANIEAHASVLKFDAMRKELALLGLMIAQETEKDQVSVTEILDKAQSSLNKMTSTLEVSKPLLISEVLRKELNDRKNRKGGLTGYRTGLKIWDKFIGGLYTGVHVVAARPAMGKTAFAVSVAVNASKNVPVCFWSGEMIKSKIALRVESYLTGIPTERLRLNKIYENEQNVLSEAHNTMSNMMLEIDDTPNLDFEQLRIKCLKWKGKYKDFVLVMDYLGLMDDKGDEYRGVTQNSKNIHALANELDISILLLHQLSRSVESRQDKLPQLSDLRASGGIEQDADTVTFLYRPDYYELKEDPVSQGIVEEGKAYAIIKKNREGKVGSVELSFIGQSSKYEDYNVDNYQPF